jgi:trans-aconitate methyltransferase
LAKRLSDLGVHVTGIDKSENMVQQAKHKYPHLKFLVADATTLNYDHEFDAVFSNATLHWVKPPKQALVCIFNSLKPGGRFVAEFGGKGNVQTIQ